MADFNNNNGDGNSGGYQGGQDDGKHESHISYVKHLSHDQADPSEPGDTGGGQQGGFISKIPGGWWTVGIGAATVIIGIIMISKMNNSNNNAAAGAPSGSSAYYPYSGSSGTSDTSNTVGGALDSQLSGLLSQEQINNQALQSILAALTPPTATTGGTNTTVNGNPTQTPLPYTGGTLMPIAKGTAGYSNNFSVYTTKAGDTLDSITNAIGWSANKQKNGGPQFLYNYRNNSDLFNQAGISKTYNPDMTLPSGIKISV
jgi:hypothetical protein